MNDQIEQEKLSILTSFLQNAPFDGWNNDNLFKTSFSLGYEKGYVYLLFPNKIKDLTIYFNDIMHKQMTDLFYDSKYRELGISEKIASLIEIKLSLYQPIKESIQSLFQYNLLPINICAAQKSLWETCNLIWYLAGDQSTDFNYYSKRALLAYVYSSSFLYYLSDDSEDFIETRKFIRKKIYSVLKLGKWKASGTKFFNHLFRSTKF